MCNTMYVIIIITIILLSIFFYSDTREGFFDEDDTGGLSSGLVYASHYPYYGSYSFKRYPYQFPAGSAKDNAVNLMYRRRYNPNALTSKNEHKPYQIFKYLYYT